MTVAYITGANAGLGRAIARSFAANGITTGLIARDAEALEKTAAELPGPAAWAVADVSSFQELERAAQKLEAQLGPPDIWVNNAMATIFSRFEDIHPDEFAHATEVTFLGSVYGIQIALKMMKPHGKGQIVQVGSALAYRAIPLQAPYCASKFAIRGAIDSLRCELIHDKSPITVTMVHMPAMNTPQFDWARRHVAQDPQPVPPIYSPDACAEAVLWATRHPDLREVWVGKPTLKAIIGNQLLPGFMDRYMAKNAYEAQFEKPAKSDYQEGNLYHTIAPFHHAHGRFKKRERKEVFWLGISESREKAFYGGLIAIALAVISGLIAI